MSITSTTIGLTWCPAIDNTSICFYKIYNADGDVYIGETDGQDWDYTVTGLSPLTSYSFYMIAVDCYGNESSPSNTITQSTIDGPAVEVPTDVTNFAYANVLEETVDLTWDAATFPLTTGGYNIYYADGVTLFHQTVGATASYSPTNLIGNTTYTLKVKAYDTLGVESLNYSNTISFLTDPVTIHTPDDVTNLVITDVETHAIDLSWDAITFVNGVGGYRIYNELGTLLQTTFGIGTTATVSGLMANTSYSFKVKAYDDLGLISDNFSNTVTDTTLNILDTGWKYPTIADFIPSFGTDWTNTTNITEDGGNYASTSMGGSGYSDFIRGYQFVLNVPSTATIVGLSVEVERGSSTGSAYNAQFQLEDISSGDIGNYRIDGSNWSTFTEYKTYGGESDMWGAALTPTMVNTPNFGIKMAVSCGATPDDADLNYFKIKVHYTMP